MKQRIKKKRNKCAPAAISAVQGSTPVSAPPVGTSASGRPCDDELTLLAEKMKPSHLKFCELYVSGVMGTQATLGAGFKDRKTGWAELVGGDLHVDGPVVGLLGDLAKGVRQIGGQVLDPWGWEGAVAGGAAG